jgi:hypothetical protein
MKRLLTENRVGIVRVSRRWFEDGTAVPMLMNRLMVCRCEFVYSTDSFEYCAYSADFDPVPQSSQPPTYVAVFKKTELAITVELVRQPAA